MESGGNKVRESRRSEGVGIRRIGENLWRKSSGSEGRVNTEIKGRGN